MVNFLASLHSDVFQYHSLNACKPAITSLHVPDDGGVNWKTSLGIKAAQGSLPNEATIAKIFRDLGYGQSAIMLTTSGFGRWYSSQDVDNADSYALVLTRPSKSVDLVKLNLSNYRWEPDGFIFQPGVLPKQARPGKLLK